MNASRVVGVDLSVAGFATVSEEALAKKLGHAAWVVWQILCTRRDRKGQTHTTLAGISRADGFESIAPRMVKKAVKRLEEAGLVERIGVRWLRVPFGKSTIAAKVTCRRVRGARQLSAVGDERVSVPGETRAWLAEAPGHGGRRMGAGRKPGNSRGSPTGNQEGPQVIQEGPQVRNSRGSIGICIPVSTESPACSGEVPPKGETTRRPKAASAPGFSDEVGEGFVGHAKRHLPAISTPLRGLPPYPGWSVVAPALVPDPAKLSADDPEEYQVRICALAFRGAVEREYGARCFLLANVSPKAKSYRTLVVAAKLFVEFGVSPFTWCIYAVRRWYLARTHTEGWKEGDPVSLPPVGVVFSKKTITEKCGDERYVGVVKSSAVGGRAIFGKTHKALLVRFAEMHAAVMRGHSIESAMGLFFPGTQYEDMVEAAKLEAHDTRHRIEREIERGRLPW